MKSFKALLMIIRFPNHVLLASLTMFCLLSFTNYGYGFVVYCVRLKALQLLLLT